MLYYTDSLGGFFDMGILYGFDLLKYEIFNEPFKGLQQSFLVFLTIKICKSNTSIVEVSSKAPVKQTTRKAALQSGLQPAFTQALQ